MSGGSYDYAYSKVEDMASTLLDDSDIPIRRAFAKHLQLVAKAMHDIEWVDSCDYGTGDDVKAIETVLGKDSNVLELREAVIEAEEAVKKLQEIFLKLKGK